jgi:hypothetical protein
MMASEKQNGVDKIPEYIDKYYLDIMDEAINQHWIKFSQRIGIVFGFKHPVASVGDIEKYSQSSTVLYYLYYKIKKICNRLGLRGWGFGNEVDGAFFSKHYMYLIRLFMVLLTVKLFELFGKNSNLMDIIDREYYAQPVFEGDPQFGKYDSIAISEKSSDGKRLYTSKEGVLFESVDGELGDVIIYNILDTSFQLEDSTVNSFKKYAEKLVTEKSYKEYRSLVDKAKKDTFGELISKNEFYGEIYDKFVK